MGMPHFRACLAALVCSVLGDRLRHRGVGAPESSHFLGAVSP